MIITLEEMKITRECCDWLNPIIKDLPDSSYETAAIDAVLNHVMRMEKALIKIGREQYGRPSEMMVTARKALKHDKEH